jgi:membrane protein DedA with SNARE-associated domain
MFEPVALYKYGLVAATIIATGFGFPLPEEIPIVTAGALVGHDASGVNPSEYIAVGGGPMAVAPPPSGLLRWWIMLPVCIVAVVIGDGVLYGMGRLFGKRLLEFGWIKRKILPPEKREKIEANFHKNGVMILLAARLTPGVRTPVFMMAGILRLPLGKFLLADGLYAIPGINILFWLAYFFTDWFIEAIHAAERYRPLIIVVVLAAIGGMLLFRLLTNRKGVTGSMEEVPIDMKPVGAVTHAVEQAMEFAYDKVTHRHHGDAAAKPPSGAGLPTPSANGVHTPAPPAVKKN